MPAAGVGTRAPSRLNNGGSSPSRDIANATRDWPNALTSSTEVSPASAPTLTRLASTGMSRRSIASAIGSGTPSSRYGTMPVSTAATTT